MYTAGCWADRRPGAAANTHAANVKTRKNFIFVRVSIPAVPPHCPRTLRANPLFDFRAQTVAAYSQDVYFPYFKMGPQTCWALDP
jgi:hypothetical protein